MEAQRSAPESIDKGKLLTISSCGRTFVQHQLLTYIKSDLEKYVEGHHEALNSGNIQKNSYVDFIIQEIGERYAIWFSSLISGVPDSSRSPTAAVYGHMTEEEFLRSYDKNPEKVLGEIIAHWGYPSIEVYLRELEDCFKVHVEENCPVGGVRRVLSVPLHVHWVRQKLEENSGVELS